MSFLTSLYLMFFITVVAVAVLAKKATQHPETTGSIAKALFQFFAKK